MISKLIVDYKLKRLMATSRASEKMVLSCIVETFLLTANCGVSIFSLNGQILLPNLDEGDITKKRYEFLIDSELPILLYNHIMIESYPKLKPVTAELNELESKLRKTVGNPWVRMLLEYFYKGEPITANKIKNLDGDKVEICAAARFAFESACANHLNNIQSTYRKKENKIIITNWLNEEARKV